MLVLVINISNTGHLQTERLFSTVEVVTAEGNQTVVVVVVILIVVTEIVVLCKI